MVELQVASSWSYCQHSAPGAATKLAASSMLAMMIRETIVVFNSLMLIYLFWFGIITMNAL